MPQLLQVPCLLCAVCAVSCTGPCPSTRVLPATSRASLPGSCSCCCCSRSCSCGCCYSSCPAHHGDAAPVAAPTADGPTYATPTSYTDALRAACTAVALIDALVASSSGPAGKSNGSGGVGGGSAGSSSGSAGGSQQPLAASAFSICRPPGHHATAVEQMGFCLLNNAALAARHAQRAHGLQKVGRRSAPHAWCVCLHAPPVVLKSAGIGVACRGGQAQVAGSQVCL